MEPVLLIHGYSSESKGSSKSDVTDIYGGLSQSLETLPGVTPVVVNVSRYISLDDGVGIDDISLALDRVLRSEHPALLTNGFNAIIHSTGALVMRNWVRRRSQKPSPLKRLIHLAGANLGSGWAHIGESLIAKWGREYFLGGTERGLAVLNALELGSDWTIDLHHHFLEPNNDMLNDYGVMEFNLVGSQVPASWLIVPIRYGKEDGSDGVVRVSASNLNFQYLRIGPRQLPSEVDWKKACAFARKTASTSVSDFQSGSFAGDYYEAKEDCRPANGKLGTTCPHPRSPVPFAIPYQCAHSSDDMGIVNGTQTKDQVLDLIKAALTTTRDNYSQQVDAFNAITNDTYERVARPKHRAWTFRDLKDKALRALLDNLEGQYDKHAQLIFRVRDQNLQPVDTFSVYFNSWGGEGKPRGTVDDMFEDKHVNGSTRNVIAFYLRTHAFNAGTKTWDARLPRVNGVDLEIDALDPDTNRILFVPLRMRIPSQELIQWVQPHRTTIIDVELLRLPASETFILY